jgi:flagellar biosynthesis chaperone FliJ
VPRYSTGAAQLKPRPKPKRDLKEVRAEKIAADIKRWQRKAKLAQTKLKRLRAKQRRYERLGIQIAA